MKKKGLLLWISLFWLALPLSAAQRGTIADLPREGEDRSLLKRSAAEFFEARLGDKAGQTRVNGARAAYQAEKDRLATLRKTGGTRKTFASMQNRLDRARKHLIETIDKKGECTARPVDHDYEAGLIPQCWYIFDGSCRFPSPDPKVREAAFDKMTDWLLHVKKYPGKAGGFHQILDLKAVDPVKLEVLPAVDKLSDPPEDMLFWVRGQEGDRVTAYWYIVRLKIRSWENTPGLREFSMRFETVDAPAGFRLPTVFDLTLFGDIRPTTPKPLSDVIGMWYLNSDGYVRNYMKGDFGWITAFIDKEGRDTGINAMVELMEKGI